MKPEDVKKEQELNEEELGNVSGGSKPGTDTMQNPLGPA